MTSEHTHQSKFRQTRSLEHARLILFCAGIVCALYIGYASLTPSTSIQPILHTDKLLHFLAYMVLAFLFCVSVSKRWRVRALLLVIAYSGAIELLQGAMNLGRTGSWLDMLANSCGAITGIIIASYIYKFWIMRRAASTSTS